ncbi:MAG: hypothetical protein ACOZNI_30065 [Myxococcota bacterium]
MLYALAFVAHAETFPLADAGVTFDLPAGWAMTRWSDWDFKAKSGDGAVQLEAWYTPFQHAPTKAAAEGFAAAYRAKLEEKRATEVALDRADVVAHGGRDVARADLKFALDKGVRGVAYAGAIALDGRVFHVVTYAAAANAAKAKRGLDQVLDRLTVQKPPGDLASLAGALPTKLGFSATLPEGWRRPLPSEEAEIAGLVGAFGPKDPAECAAAVRPAPGADTDLMLLCKEEWAFGPLDAASFADKAALVKQARFGKAADKVPADPIEAKDRVGVLLRPEINDKDLRLGIVPYDGGAAVGWAIGARGRADALEAALRPTLAGLAYEGADGGLARYDVGTMVFHTLTYDPLHPGVLCCAGASLVFVGGIAVVVFRPRRRAET